MIYSDGLSLYKVAKSKDAASVELHSTHVQMYTRSSRDRISRRETVRAVLWARFASQPVFTKLRQVDRDSTLLDVADPLSMIASNPSVAKIQRSELGDRLRKLLHFRKSIVVL